MGTPEGASWLRRSAGGLADEGLDLLDELAHVLELPVHRGEPDVRHVVHLEQLRHHPLADPDRGDLFFGAGLEFLFEGFHEVFDGVCAYGALFARLADAGEDLLAVVRLAPSVPLHDEGELLLDPLIGREPPPAGEAFPPSPYDVAVLARPGIDHLVVHVAAPGALHEEGSASFRSCIPTSSTISRVRVSLYPSR